MIKYFEDSRKFSIQTENSSYFMGIDEDGRLRNLYYGEKINNAQDVDFDMKLISGAFTQDTHFHPKQEYITREKLIFSEPCLFGEFDDGTKDFQLLYKSHEITEDGKKLSITLKDIFYDLEVVLNYQVYEGLDLISKNAVIKNLCNQALRS